MSILGTIGVLTPQANPTVEPELVRLFGERALMATTRMCSAGETMLDRLRAYGDEVDRWIASFGGMRIDVFAFACTGTFYLYGMEKERIYLRRLEARGARVQSATTAIQNALSVLNARRVVLVNPYPPELLDAALTYWRSAGVEIVTVIDVKAARGGHPIYGIDPQATVAALERAVAIPADAVLCTGTGMATLPALRQVRADKPILSSNLCLAWSSLNVLGAGLDLRSWLDGVTSR
jgi:maleate isomerase